MLKEALQTIIGAVQKMQLEKKVLKTFQDGEVLAHIPRTQWRNIYGITELVVRQRLAALEVPFYPEIMENARIWQLSKELNTRLNCLVESNILEQCHWSELTETAQRQLRRDPLLRPYEREMSLLPGHLELAEKNFFIGLREQMQFYRQRINRSHLRLVRIA